MKTMPVKGLQRKARRKTRKRHTDCCPYIRRTNFTLFFECQVACGVSSCRPTYGRESVQGFLFLVLEKPDVKIFTDLFFIGLQA